MKTFWKRLKEAGEQGSALVPRSHLLYLAGMGTKNYQLLQVVREAKTHFIICWQIKKGVVSTHTQFKFSLTGTTKEESPFSIYLSGVSENINQNF